MGERPKRKIWSKYENELMYELIRKHEDIITSRETNNRMNDLKKKAWQLVCDEFNASNIGEEPKTVEQLKNKFSNERKLANQKQRQLNGTQVERKPIVLPPPPLILKVADAIQASTRILRSDLHAQLGDTISDIEIANEDSTASGAQDLLQTAQKVENAAVNGEEATLPTEDDEPSISIGNIRSLKKTSKIQKSPFSRRSGCKARVKVAEEMAMAAKARRVNADLETQLSIKYRTEEHELRMKVLRAKLEAQEAKRDYYLGLAEKKLRTDGAQPS